MTMLFLDKYDMVREFRGITKVVKRNGNLYVHHNPNNIPGYDDVIKLVDIVKYEKVSEGE